VFISSDKIIKGGVRKELNIRLVNEGVGDYTNSQPILIEWRIKQYQNFPFARSLLCIATF
jgi:hypothetical protein